MSIKRSEIEPGAIFTGPNQDRRWAFDIRRICSVADGDIVYAKYDQRGEAHYGRMTLIAFELWADRWCGTQTPPPTAPGHI